MLFANSVGSDGQNWLMIEKSYVALSLSSIFGGRVEYVGSSDKSAHFCISVTVLEYEDDF